VGLGLPGGQLSMVNPASVAGLPAPALLVTYQPESYDFDAGDVSGTGSVGRFPLIQAAIPFRRRFVATLGYGSYLDRRWRAEAEDTIQLNGEDQAVRDRYVSEGGVGRLRFGGAYLLHDRLAVGASVDVLTGVVRDSVIRRFPADTGVDVIAPSVRGQEWEHSGIAGTVGARWSPHDAVTVAASVTAGGKIMAEADSASLGKEYSMPLAFDVGASARIARSTTVAAALKYTGWGDTDAELTDGAGGARDLRSVSGGIEYEGFSLGRRTLPLRLGARYTELPFRWGSKTDGNEFPNETAFSGGLGVRMAGGAALADLAVERGSRGGDAAGFDESYWRFTVSLTLLGR
jgi:hypothetical protein